LFSIFTIKEKVCKTRTQTEKIKNIKKFK